jgi:predicted amidohydrolase YtcJ
MKCNLTLLLGAFLLLLNLRVEIVADEQPVEPADLILLHGKVLTVDNDFRVVQALAVKGERLVAVGSDKEIARYQGPKTTVLDAGGKTVLPGLYDSHVHPVGAATSELVEPLPELRSLEDVFTYIRKKTKETPEGNWIVLRYAFPTRLKEARFPTKAELDAAAPKHPVLYHAGPAGMANTMALKVSGVTKDTPNPEAGVIVKDPKTGEPTGMLRNAYGVLKGVPAASTATAAQTRAAVKKLFQLYNAHGITSVADRNGDRKAVDLYYDLHQAGELTLRVNVARGLGTSGTREQIAARLDAMPGKDGKGGPTGVGGIWIRIGPIKFFLDGGMLNGTAYMRTPWPKGDTYQVVEDDYRGLLFVEPEQVKIVVEECTKRGWQVTAHTAGEGAMDVLLDAYDFVNRGKSIKEMRHCITHANFPSQRNLERCKELGVVADVQPAWLYKDGATLARVLGEKRIQWFQPYKSWLKYTTIGGGSDHMIKLDPRSSTNPWDPWLGIHVAVTRKIETGTVLNPDERLTREQALRMYTINNAFLNREEKDKGSLEVGKLADFIIIDRDYLTCPEDDLLGVQVLRTVVGGKTVFEHGK